MSELEARRHRAALRRQRSTLTVTTLAASRPPVPPTAVERLALLAELSDEAWMLTGRPFPCYRRDEMPGRVIRPGDSGES